MKAKTSSYTSPLATPYVVTTQNTIIQILVFSHTSMYFIATFVLKTPMESVVLFVHLLLNTLTL